MNKYILERLTYLYNTFAKLDTASEGTSLSEREANNINNALIEMNINYYSNYSQLDKEEFELLKQFYNTCSAFYDKYLNAGTCTYSKTALHRCYKKIDGIYKSLMKYV